MCFFSFLRAGDLATTTSFDITQHLAWGDVAIDCSENPQMLKIHLKKSKTDQLEKVVDVYTGKTACSLCPLNACLQYMMARGTEPGSFFLFKNGQPLTKSAFKTGAPSPRPSARQLRRTQLPDWSRNFSSPGRHRRFNDQENGKVE